jgi:hypothetical protein
LVGHVDGGGCDRRSCLLSLLATPSCCRSVCHPPERRYTAVQGLAGFGSFPHRTPRADPMLTRHSALNQVFRITCCSWWTLASTPSLAATAAFVSGTPIPPRSVARTSADTCSSSQSSSPTTSRASQASASSSEASTSGAMVYPDLCVCKFASASTCSIWTSRFTSHSACLPCSNYNHTL